MKTVLAFDFGASSGRAILAHFDGETIRLEEVHRFSNDPVEVGGVFYWDVLRLFHEIRQGLLKAKAAGGFDSVGIDTWGVDFGLLDADGRLLENPVHYRDRRTAGYIEKSRKYISNERLYALTGIQLMELNTCFQLLSLKEQRPALLERAECLLFMPDLLSYFLTGKKYSEYSIATTSGLVDIKARDWSGEIAGALGIPRRILQPLVKTGTVIGPLSPALCESLGLPPADVIAVAGHDTQSAITAVPCETDDFAFISSGTWSLFGTEPAAPIISETTLKHNFTNEGGYGYATGFLKNICGLWLIQESRRQWQREGQDYSYAQLEAEARSCEPFRSLIDTDDPRLGVPGDIPGRIRTICEETGQPAPRTVGETVRCIYESLAMKYRLVFEGLQTCTGKRFAQINVVGGGTKDGFLCGMTADSCGVPVVAGPTEATVLGNVAIQLMAQGEIPDVPAARRIIAASSALKRYEPENAAVWAAAYARYRQLLG